MLKLRKIYRRGFMEDWRVSAFVIGVNISATLVLISALSGHWEYFFPIVLSVFLISALFLRGRQMPVIFDMKEVVFWSTVDVALLAFSAWMQW